MRWYTLPALVITALMFALACDPEIDYPHPSGIEAPTQHALGLTYRWAHPTSGSVVDHYLVQVEYDGVVGGMQSPSNVAVVPYTRGRRIRVRVAGVDAAGRQGPWSEWSEYYHLKPFPERHEDFVPDPEGSE
jgi:hypothetical protein